MLQFIQSTPISVYATGHAHKEIYQKASDNDQILICVKFENGALATIDLSRNSTYGYDQRMEIFTLKGESSTLSFYFQNMLVQKNQQFFLFLFDRKKFRLCTIAYYLYILLSLFG